MQTFRNMTPPETGDIHTIPGFYELTEHQQEMAQRLFNEAYEACAGRGVRIASGMAFETVKQRILEGTLPDSIANIPRAPIPQAHGMVDTTPKTPEPDSMEHAFMAMVGKMLANLEMAKSMDPESSTSSKLQKINVGTKEAMRNESKIAEDDDEMDECEKCETSEQEIKEAKPVQKAKKPIETPWSKVEKKPVDKPKPWHEGEELEMNEALTPGSKLTAGQHQKVLDAFVHRHTGEHKPAWANKPMPNGGKYEPTHKTDKEWVHDHAFHFTKKGELDRKHDHAEPAYMAKEERSMEDQIMDSLIESLLSEGNPSQGKMKGAMKEGELPDILHHIGSEGKIYSTNAKTPQHAIERVSKHLGSKPGTRFSHIVGPSGIQRKNAIHVGF